MKLQAFFFTFLLFTQLSYLNGYMYHQKKIESEWKEDHLPPFNELMISWNATRPLKGKYLFFISVKTDSWSPWLLYASWGKDGQTSFCSTTNDAPVRVYQDMLEVLESKQATGFQIKIISEEKAPLESIHGLHVYTNSDKTEEPLQTLSYSSPIQLQVKGLSQMALNHIRHQDLCSPTSTTAVVQYLLNNTEIDPIHFAQNSWDSNFDIFGNWVLNVAQAAAELGKSWNCWVERLNGFDEIYQSLHKGTPVVVSVRGPLPGSALPYAKGHLIAVIGYDPLQQKVICMDPAFPNDSETTVFYNLSDFLQAWNRRGRVAYLFSKNS